MTRRRFSALATATALSSSGHAKSLPLRLRVLSFNLRYINDGDTGWKAWTARRDAAAALIRRDQPDVIGLQEALRPMLDDLAQRITGYEEIGVGREDGKTQGEYAAILVRRDRFTVRESGTFWLSDTPAVANSRSWGNTVTRICTWALLHDRPTERNFCCINTHFDHESQPARLKSAAAVLDHLARLQPKGPLVLTGDFNAGESDPVVTTLTNGSIKLVDSWRHLNPAVPASESGTLHFFSGKRDGPKIDYIFVPPDTQILEAQILHDGEGDAFPSDHFPIRATIEFKA